MRDDNYIMQTIILLLRHVLSYRSTIVPAKQHLKFSCLSNILKTKKKGTRVDIRLKIHIKKYRPNKNVSKTVKS